MKQFKNALLIAPVDKRLASLSTSILNASQSKLTLMSVAPIIENPIIQSGSGQTVDLQALMVNELKNELEAAAEQFKDSPIRIGTEVVVGQAFIEIIRQVVKKKHDLVMMSADGISTLRQQLFGTTSMHLMRKCPCPVWVVKPSRRQKMRVVFAAVDPENDSRNRLNIEIIQRAQAIAKSENAKLHVVHAWNPLGIETTHGRGWMTKPEIRLYMEKVADVHRKRLAQLLESETDGSAVTHMLQGRPGSVIPEVVSNEGADLLVMGTVCRTGIPGFFIGNTAEMILGQVDCSVLTVKPAEFVTPVKLT